MSAALVVTVRAMVPLPDVGDGPRVLAVRHVGADYFALPGGKVDAGDASLLAALRREIQEEFGVEISGEPLLVGVHEFRHPVYGGQRVEFFFQLDKADAAALENAPGGTHTAAEIAEVAALSLPEAAKKLRPAGVLEALEGKESVGFVRLLPPETA